jgi:type I restriction enzyme S subunit
MKDWRQRTLGEFVSLQRGHDLPSDSRGDGQIPVMGSFGITGYHTVSRAKGPGVTVGRSGASAGVVSYIDKDYWPLNTCLFVTDFKGNNTRFAFYFLKTLDLASYNAGSAQPSLNRNHISPLPILVPERTEQDLIANVLAAIDDKIELNRRMNETLEGMAQAIFKDWFVDFGPTRRKLAGITDPVATMGGLIPDAARATELAALFPDAFGEDGLPTGWTYKNLGDLFDIKIGRTPPRKESQHFTTSNNGIPWMSIRDLGVCGTFISETAECLTRSAAIQFRVPKIEKGTVVLSFKLTVGRVAIADRDMLSNEAIAQLGHKSESPSTWFAYCWLKQYDFSVLGSTSSIATAVNSASVRSIRIIWPDMNIHNAFTRLAQDFFELIRLRESEERTLAETRDYLLPKLMSGEVRVCDAEKLAEGAHA